MKKADRILKHEEFAQIAKKGQRYHGKNIALHYLVRKDGRARVGITVSKKNGNAVTRNLIKRQIRSILDENLVMDAPIDLIVLARYSYDTEKFRANKDELVGGLKAIGASKIEEV